MFREKLDEQFYHGVSGKRHDEVNTGVPTLCRLLLGVSGKSGEASHARNVFDEVKCPV